MEQTGISSLVVEGYKSIAERQEIAIAPLTILAGANSSGKSSMMQPLLLLKQTMEATFDPGPLLLNGPNIKLNAVEQVLSHVAHREDNPHMVIGIGVDGENMVELHFTTLAQQGFQLAHMVVPQNGGTTIFQEGMEMQAFAKALPPLIKDFSNAMQSQGSNGQEIPFTIKRERCFLYVQDTKRAFFRMSPVGMVPETIHAVIHLPGMRGNPERYYPVTAVTTRFPGTFEYYIASIIEQWQTDGNDESRAKHQCLCEQLRLLSLTNKIKAHRIDATRIELFVSRFVDQDDAVADTNIADVGIGVSLVLPILVALLVAEPGQLVSIEEPEIHLHPRAQIALAEVIAQASQRGVRVVVETHSSLLLIAVQTLVAEGKLDPSLTKLHWFSRQDGITHITTTDLDRSGAFDEDWPEDFVAIEMDLKSSFLDAAEFVQSEMIA